MLYKNTQGLKNVINFVSRMLLSKTLKFTYCTLADHYIGESAVFTRFWRRVVFNCEANP